MGWEFTDFARPSNGMTNFTSSLILDIALPKNDYLNCTFNLTCALVKVSNTLRLPAGLRTIPQGWKIYSCFKMNLSCIVHSQILLQRLKVYILMLFRCFWNTQYADFLCIFERLNSKFNWPPTELSDELRTESWRRLDASANVREWRLILRWQVITTWLSEPLWQRDRQWR